MENRRAIIHQNRMKSISKLVPVNISDSDLNWLVDWILAIGIGTIEAVLHKNPKLTLHDLFLLTTKLPGEINH